MCDLLDKMLRNDKREVTIKIMVEVIIVTLKMLRLLLQTEKKMALEKRPKKKVMVTLFPNSDYNRIK